MVFLSQSPHHGLEGQCLASLGQSHYAAIRSLHCRVTNDTVTLCGTVPTYYTRQVAVHIVDEIPGINRVVDRIQVSFPDGPGHTIDLLRLH